MSKKIKKQVPSREETKTSEKPIPSLEGGGSVSPKIRKKPVKSQIVSNTEEGGITTFLWGTLCVVVFVCAVYATKPLWIPHVLNYLPPLETATTNLQSRELLVDRVNQLEKEIMLVRKSGQAISDLEVERAHLNKNFEGVMSRIIALEKQINNVREMKMAMTPQTDAFITNESLSRLNSRMMDIEKSDMKASAVLERLKKLEQIVTEKSTEKSSSAKGLLQTMTDISERVSTLENDADQSPQREVNLAEEKRQVRAQNLVLAVGHLRESLRSSDPFVESLKALRVIGGEDPDIQSGLEELTPFAETGILTMDALRREFNIVAENIRQVTSQNTSRKNVESPLSEVFNQVTSLVTVRKTGTENPEGYEINPVGNARIQLDQGNLEGAIATLSDLQGVEAEVVASWLADARARLIAEKTLSKLHVFVVSVLATSIK